MGMNHNVKTDYGAPVRGNNKQNSTFARCETLELYCFALLLHINIRKAAGRCCDRSVQVER